ncbi:uncharacterized protein [Linepithema humile]|uniref:uncharacterized protein isoform X2 n=1 Tax=Linepithema humile TaxID=83485 RepID=UPI00351DDCC9
MKDFIQEYKNLCDNGLVIDTKLYSVTVSAFICDAPARAFIKVIKGHNGFYGCERCTQKGTHPFGATIFNKINAESRTDESFLLQTQLGHHNGISPLTEINFPMVTNFILDSMHLVHLGVMKKILFEMVQGNNYFSKLDTRRINCLSQILESLHEYIPIDFSRKPRNLNKIRKWKATELRQFVLYTGLFVFNGIIPNNHIDHFKIFHTAIFILSHPTLAVQLCNYAQTLLIEFVKTFDEYFGLSSKIYNVHNLVHIADDVKNFKKPLDDISSFDFENLLGKIKRSLRGGKQPLSQLSRRLSENQNFISEEYIFNCKLKRQHKCGPLIAGMESSMKKYSIVEFIEENTVEIILSSWISSNNKTALWPKDITPSILRKYLKNNTVPNDNWSSVNIKVLGHTDSFANATKKAYKAEETSHLSNSDSDLETYCTTKRQKKLPLRYQSNSDDEDVALEKQHVHSTKRTKHSVLPPFPEYEDCEITKTNQHKELPRDSLIINSPTVCNTNAKNQRKEEINAEKSNNIQHFKEGKVSQPCFWRNSEGISAISNEVAYEEDCFNTLLWLR